MTEESIAATVYAPATAISVLTVEELSAEAQSQDGDVASMEHPEEVIHGAADESKRQKAAAAASTDAPAPQQSQQECTNYLLFFRCEFGDEWYSSGFHGEANVKVSPNENVRCGVEFVVESVKFHYLGKNLMLGS